jgi:hypothetical protein
VINKLPRWLQAIIYIGGFFLILNILNFLYKEFTIELIIVWLLVPIVMFILSVNKTFTKLTYKEVIRLKWIVMGIKIIISFIFFVHYDTIIDDIGKKYIEG